MEGKVSKVYSALSHHLKNLSENMTDQNKPVTLGESSSPFHPSEFVKQLASWLDNKAFLSPRNKKNLLLRLARLGKDIDRIPKNFTPHESWDKSMSGLAS